MASTLQDLRYALRSLGRNPGFTSISVVTLAVGIGATTTIFSAVNALLLRPIPVEDPQELVEVMATNRRATRVSGSLSYPDYVDIRDQNDVFEGLVAYGAITVSLSTGGLPEQVAGEIVSGNYFDVLRVRPVQGRTFTPEEDQVVGRDRVVVLNYELWQRKLGGSPGVVGSTVTINGSDYAVIGVAPRGFHSPTLGRSSDLWIPMAMQPQVRPPSAGLRRSLGGYNLLQTRGPSWLRVVARLKKGVSRSQADAALDTIARRLAVTYPDTNDERLFVVGDLNAYMRAEALPVLTLLMVVVGFVLLIACSNVANLLLAKASARGKEISIRMALGAGRLRLARQLLTESVLLSLLGAAAALLLCQWSVDFLYRFEIPPAVDLGLDWRVFGFAFLVSLLTAVLFGFFPAFYATRARQALDLKTSAVSEGPAGAGAVLRSGFVVAQVALSFILLIGAGLFARTLDNVRRTDPGFSTENTLLARVNLDPLGYSDEQGQAFYRRLCEELRALPSVSSVALSRVLVLSGSARTWAFMPEGDVVEEGQTPDLVQVNVVNDDYLPTLEIPILRGRNFGPTDRMDSVPVSIVTKSLAERYWPNQDPIGKRYRNSSDGPLIEVIGIAEDNKYLSLREEARPFVYLPLSQNYESGVTLHVKTTSDPLAVLPAVRELVQRLDPNLPLFRVGTLTQQLEISMGDERLASELLGIFSLLAMALAAVGLYGVLAFWVYQRTREIGIRNALGASPEDNLRWVLRHGLQLAALGMMIGLLGALGLVRFVSGMLYGVSSRDPLTFLVILVVLTVVSLLACLYPAWRASRVDPLVTLRYE